MSAGLPLALEARAAAVFATVREVYDCPNLERFVRGFCFEPFPEKAIAAWERLAARLRDEKSAEGRHRLFLGWQDNRLRKAGVR